MPTAQQIAADFGLKNVDAIWAAAANTGLDFAMACALIQKESGGRNVFGSDKGGLYKGEEVTEAKYRAMVKAVKDGATSNGVGLTQITWAGNKVDGRRDGGYFTQAEKQGLRLWVPLDNCMFGFALLLQHYKDTGSWAQAGRRYNGARIYGTDLVRKIGEWRTRLAAAAEDEGDDVVAVVWRGKRFDQRTKLMLEEVARRTKAYVRPTQGSYNTSVGASAGTHAGGGAVDISCQSLPEDQALEIVRVMREVGFAAWMRKPAEGNWPEHIHGIAIGCPDLAPAAARQVTAYRKGLSGLASGAKDRHASMGVKPRTWEQYLEGLARPVVDRPRISVARVIAAAKHDPDARQGEGLHPDDVRPVEKALKAEGLLPAEYAADGAFGTRTREAYAAWQRSPSGGGFRGVAADGIPGTESLRRLGKKYGFEVGQ